MDKLIIECKLYQYLERMSLANKAGDKARAKKAAGMSVVLARMQAREAVAALVAAEAEETAVGRAIAKAKENGITFPIGGQRLKQLADVSAQKRKDLAAVGDTLCMALDVWQASDATLHDLANLCNRRYEDVVQEIEPERLNMEFSGLVFAYNLDYKDVGNRGWIDFDVDAPLTHAVKEFWLDLMLQAKEGWEAYHRALVEWFPATPENALRLVTDADGVRRLIDKDGVEVGTVGSEG